MSPDEAVGLWGYQIRLGWGKGRGKCVMRELDGKETRDEVYG